MPRRTQREPLEAALREFSRQLGAQIAAGIEQGLRAAMQGKGAGALGVGAPEAPRTGCLVPGCGREAISKGLCQNHYQKARRLELPAGALSDAQLAQLARDLRAVRGRR